MYYYSLNPGLFGQQRRGPTVANALLVMNDWSTAIAIQLRLIILSCHLICGVVEFTRAIWVAVADEKKKRKKRKRRRKKDGIGRSNWVVEATMQTQAVYNYMYTVMYTYTI